MTIFSGSTPGQSMIEFLELQRPLPEHAMNVREKLKRYHLYLPKPYDPDPDSLRYSEHVDVTLATGVLLDALVIPCYIYDYYLIKSCIEDENYPVEGTKLQIINYHHIYDQINNQIHNLIKWRREANGSLIFITEEGEVSTEDIGISIANSDVEKFYEIVAEMTVEYMNKSISYIVSKK